MSSPFVRRVSEADDPARRLSRGDAFEIAKEISDRPRSGRAYMQFVGAYDAQGCRLDRFVCPHSAWIVEVYPRSAPYGNPFVVRESGRLASYF